ncbi:MAG: low molecular weight protein-tyrosine-phosphatase [Muribaculaceae bacterium]
MVSDKVNPKTIELIESLKDKDKIRVLFVCLGNICRSPAAEGVLRRIVDEAGDGDRWTIDSAGIGRWHVGDLPDKRMRIHARDRGLELTHRCRQVRPYDFDNFDLIIGMDSQNIEDLRELAPSPEAEARIIPMGDFLPASSNYYFIPDPYYEGSEGFELVLDLLEEACRDLYATLTPAR